MDNTHWYTLCNTQCVSGSGVYLTNNKKKQKKSLPKNVYTLMYDSTRQQSIATA